MSIALGLTSLRGLIMWFTPLNGGMIVLYAFWGLTTILLFWAALISDVLSLYANEVLSFNEVSSAAIGTWPIS